MTRRVAVILVCVFLASLIWKYESIRTTSTSKEKATLRVIVSSDLVNLTDVENEYVEYTIQGPSKKLGELRRPEVVRLLITKDQLEAGRQEQDVALEITPEIIFSNNLPYNLEVGDIKSSIDKITISPKIKKLLKVKAQIVGKPADGYEVNVTYFIPDEVAAYGPSNVLQDVTEINTIPIDVSDAASTINLNRVYLEQEIDGYEVDLRGRNVVEAYIQIRGAYTRKKFSQLVIHTLINPNAPINFSILDSKNDNLLSPKVDVEFRGPPEIMKTLEPIAYLDLSNDKILAAKAEYEVEFLLPADVEIVGDPPARRLEFK